MRRAFWTVAAFTLGACVRYHGQSPLDPASPHAAAIHRLWSFMLPMAGVVYLIVIAALVLVIRRRPVPAEEARAPAREAAARRTVLWAVAGTVTLAFVLLVYDLAVARALAAGDSSPELTIHVTGHQWWWEVEYEDPVAQNRVTVANEIHVPAGRRVLVKLDARDVIHSFWVPNLDGKKDLIPGHHTELWLRADSMGTYRGQCAEFCGAEHARMALLVVSESPDAFAAWIAHQRTPPPLPADSLAARGRLIFEAGPCGTCHTVVSTRAGGRVGPDLTHVASRRTLAAGTLPNTPGNLAGWILDPQTIKPGAQMPATALAPQDLRALVAYLGTLR